MSDRPVAIDLFCGAGGLSQGLTDAGFDVRWGLDSDADAITTYNHNHEGYALERDIQTFSLDGSEIDIDPEEDEVPEDEIDALELEPGEVDLIAGGPPCPTFSKVGRSKIRSFDGETPERDERHELYQNFLRLVDHYRPKAFIMENVEGILSAENDEGEQVANIIKNEMAELGYRVEAVKVDAANFGVPQHRTRAFFLANRLHTPNPDLTQWRTHREPIREKEKQLHRPGNRNIDGDQTTVTDWGVEPEDRYGEDVEKNTTRRPWITVADAILDLPPVSPGGEMPPKEATKYTIPPVSEYQEWVRDVDEEQEGQTLYNHRSRGHNLYDLTLYKLLGEGVGWNIGEVGLDLQPYREDIFADKYKKQNPKEPASTIVAHLQKDGHMFIHPREARSLTVREAARLQSFRDSFRFPVARTAAFRLVGNAVPPRLGEVIGKAVREEVVDGS
ncbi:DNA cytosine methyltransferase [Halomicrococcus sp. SG-WS-1]|uniref:DNA cytosine methyltransferase n=1 Tax=Halomicrococcus sp. SG-WS-1 TaxID=3439057 RepID=UPI003F78B2C9